MATFFYNFPRNMFGMSVKNSKLCTRILMDIWESINELTRCWIDWPECMFLFCWVTQKSVILLD